MCVCVCVCVCVCARVCILNLVFSLRSLGFTIAGLERSNDRGIRLEALHMRGVEHMEEADVMTYFAEFEPSAVEWIDQESCEYNALKKGCVKPWWQ